MRILLSAVPAFGHLLPLLPLGRAALEQGHEVAVLTGADMAPVIETELPGASPLIAGAGAPELIGTAVSQEGFDVARPTPATEGALFGRVRASLGLADSVRVARPWRPEVVIAEAYDSIGPAVAGAVQVPWFRFGIGPGAPEEDQAVIRDTARPFAEQLAIEVASPTAYLDPCPPALKPAGWTTDAPVVLPIRPEAHRSLAGSASVPRLGDGVLHVLVTLGTIFSDPAVLEQAVRGARAVGAEVIATEGLLLSPQPGTVALGDDPAVHLVPFAPLADLLEAVDVVVGAGGSGTVFGAAATGRPMVLLPQGADQHAVSAAAAAAGFAIVVEDPSGIEEALRTIETSGKQRLAAAAVQRQIATQPEPADVVRTIVHSTA